MIRAISDSCTRNGCVPSAEVESNYRSSFGELEETGVGCVASHLASLDAACQMPPVKFRNQPLSGWRVADKLTLRDPPPGLRIVGPARKRLSHRMAAVETFQLTPIRFLGESVHGQAVRGSGKRHDAIANLIEKRS